MLNITHRICLSKNSKKIIKKYWRNRRGVLDAHSWNSINNRVKNDISKKSLKNQGFKCVFCQRYLYGQSPELEHFANKALYARFSFNPINIFYSCHFCNSTDRKGILNTILIYNNRYDQCMFSILHPYLDDIDAQLIYQDEDKVLFDWLSCSQRARDTIVSLILDDPIMSNIRSRDLLYQRLNPLTSISENELIQLSIAYK
ncbi:MAG: hypothetical protein Q8891_00090 [Bacteroidota bacterium]|nr:hypothetical protein [Bacteroidota bacterium]